MAFDSVEEILDKCFQGKLLFWEAVLEDDMRERGVKREESLSKMRTVWEAMLTSAVSYEKNARSKSGLSGGDGDKMERYAGSLSESSICGKFMGRVMATALMMGESNACMRRVVAAPTAGACGVLPAVLVPYYQHIDSSVAHMVEALYTAAGLGQVIAKRAFLSGAMGGCQAEVGSASAMAAGALVHLKGGNSRQIADAASMALKNLLGLVCDPVAGLVEVPCIKRNVIGAVNAASSADMALAGIESRVPADQVIDAMRDVGERMDPALKETSGGGLAKTKMAGMLEEALAKKSIKA